MIARVLSLVAVLAAAPAVSPVSTGTGGNATSSTAAAGAKDAGAHAAIQARYDKLCKSCHGADGKGNAAKAKTLKIDATKLDLTRAEAANLTKEERRKILLEGKEKMPAYAKKLKPEEVDAMVEFVEGLRTAAPAGGTKP